MSAMTEPPETPPKIARVRPRKEGRTDEEVEVTQDQIVGVLKEQEAGLAVAEIGINAVNVLTGFEG
jgi:hypothetical protein